MDYYNTNYECNECNGCENCEHCYDCVKSSKLYLCDYCNYSHDCFKSNYLIHCSKCNYCNDCDNCNNCDDCHNCKNCNNCSRLNNIKNISNYNPTLFFSKYENYINLNSILNNIYKENSNYKNKYIADNYDIINEISPLLYTFIPIVEYLIFEHDFPIDLFPKEVIDDIKNNKLVKSANKN